MSFVFKQYHTSVLIKNVVLIKDVDSLRTHGNVFLIWLLIIIFIATYQHNTAKVCQGYDKEV